MEYKEFREFWDKAAIYYNQQHGKTCDGCGLLCSSGGCLLSYPYDVTEEQFNFVQNFVDWSEVPVDANIVVWTDYVPKCKRHFAKYEDGKVYSFGRGKSSYTADNENDLEVWQYAELYKED